MLFFLIDPSIKNNWKKWIRHHKRSYVGGYGRTLKQMSDLADQMVYRYFSFVNSTVYKLFANLSITSDLALILSNFLKEVSRGAINPFDHVISEFRIKPDDMPSLSTPSQALSYTTLRSFQKVQPQCHVYPLEQVPGGGDKRNLIWLDKVDV